MKDYQNLISKIIIAIAIIILAITIVVASNNISNAIIDASANIQSGLAFSAQVLRPAN